MSIFFKKKNDEETNISIGNGCNINQRNINNGNISSSGNIIINGKIIKGNNNFSSSNMHDFIADEEVLIKLSELDDFNVLNVNSSLCNIVLASSPLLKNDILLGVNGCYYAEKEISINYKSDYGILSITAEDEENVVTNGMVTLTVVVPEDFSVENLLCVSSSGNFSSVVESQNVKIEDISIKTQSGKINISKKHFFKKGTLNTMSGNICVNSNCFSDIEIEAKTMSGCIIFEILNIGNIDMNASSMSGKVTKYHKSKLGYNAIYNLKTMSGHILVS